MCVISTPVDSADIDKTEARDATVGAVSDAVLLCADAGRGDSNFPGFCVMTGNRGDARENALVWPVLVCKLQRAFASAAIHLDAQAGLSGQTP